MSGCATWEKASGSSLYGVLLQKQILFLLEGAVAVYFPGFFLISVMVNTERFQVSPLWTSLLLGLI